MKVLVYCLGQKGFRLVEALVKNFVTLKISCVIGKDVGVSDDYNENIKKLCTQNKIDIIERDNLIAVNNKFDLFLAAGWRWIIRDIPHQKLIIFHDSLLPKYRGFAPLVSALINRETKVGVTALFGLDQYDCGNILLQKSLDVHYPTTIGNEIDRISVIYAELAVELVAKFISGQNSIVGHQQDEHEATYSLWRDEEDYRIDWNADSSDIVHFINCVGNPYRGASAILNGELVRILKATSISDVKIENRVVGKVIFNQKTGPIVVCGKGLLAIEDMRNDLGEYILPLSSFRSRFS